MADKLDNMLKDDNEMKLENINLAVEREQIFTRMNLLTQEKDKFKKLHMQLSSEFEIQKKELDRERALGLNDRNQFSAEKSGLELKVRSLEEQITRERIDFDHKLSVIRLENENQIQSMQKINDDLMTNKQAMDQFEIDRDKLNNRIAQLEKELAKEKKEHIFDVTQAERDKLQATEKLRREMLKQIKMTKASLLSLNDDQLQTTTRLTILQNTQLTIELEYQSKQTEQLLFKNSQMQSQIDTLQRDVAIHKEVESELAKRSHFC